MPRTVGEKAKIEKRIKLERTLIPIVCVIGIAVFLVLSAVMAKNTGSSSGADVTPEPTEDPSYQLIRRLTADMGGTFTEAEGFASASFISSVDEKNVAVSAHTESGIVCMQLARSFPVPQKTETTAAPTQTQSIFVVDNTPAPSEAAAVPTEKAIPFDLEPYAEELCRCLSYLHEPEDSAACTANIKDALRLMIGEDAKKSSIVFGIYLVEFSYSPSDSLLKMTCEPI